MANVVEVEIPALVTVTKKLLVPPLVGVPVTAPAEERLKPAGKTPALIVQV